MGCCLTFIKKCCFIDDKDDSEIIQDIFPNEQTRLLRGSIKNNLVNNGLIHSDYDPQYRTSLTKQKDKNCELNKILQDTIAHVIDVSALDAYNLEQHEHGDRLQLYSYRMQYLTANGKTMVKSNIKNSALHDIQISDKFFLENNVSETDILQVTEISSKISQVIQNMKILSDDPLVLPLKI